jgi:hypothetical protein
MDVRAAAAMSVVAMTVQGAQAALGRAVADPVPASAPVTEHADVVLELSAAASRMLSAS